MGPQYIGRANGNQKSPIMQTHVMKSESLSKGSPTCQSPQMLSWLLSPWPTAGERAVGVPHSLQGHYEDVAGGEAWLNLGSDMVLLLPLYLETC